MRKYVIMLFCGLLFCACERDKSPMAPRTGDFVYPLKAGNQWEYQRLYYSFNFRSLQEGRTFPSDTVRATVTVRIVKEVVLQDSIKTVQLLEEYVDSTMSLTDESYYDNKQGGLYLYAYRNASGIPMMPKKATVAGIEFNGRHFQNISEITRLLTHAVTDPASDSLIYETPPRLCLKYPFTLNSQWTSLKAGPFRIDKKIISQEEVSVPAGTFSCYKIQWMYDINSDGAWDKDIVFYDYVCEKGLVKRSIVYRDIQATGMDLEPLGTYDAVDEGQLSRVILK
jgi:hypothetical protein